MLNNQNKPPARIIAAGKVSTHAISKLITVDFCRPALLATIVPATPYDNTCVVDTGKPNISAAAIVDIATNSAEAPCP